MIVMDNDGKIFDERRKSDRNTEKDSNGKDGKVFEDRRKRDINKSKQDILNNEE